jgi:hypothetical protein
MTALKREFSTHVEALENLPSILNECGFQGGVHSLSQSQVIRKKVEVPYSTEINTEDYIYIECHYSLFRDGASDSGEGLSRNLMSGDILRTERCYDQKEFHNFAIKHSHRKVELALLDTNPLRDAGWVPLPKSYLKNPLKVSENFGKRHRHLLRNIV